MESSLSHCAGAAPPEVSIIVPARNEEAGVGACLESLLAQQGVSLEIFLVDDGSTDRTREIAQSFPGVQVIDAEPLPAGWSGKSNAVCTAARRARGQWLLFTDADTVHLPGSLERSLREASEHGAALLSYSPAQEVHGLGERAVMPVIFAELAGTYKPAEVNDPASPAAAANGQYLLISRAAYEAVGGHAAVAESLLEDVALARAVKRSGRTLRFRFGGDAVRTRMYRSFSQLCEGWTKNLALLFARPLQLALLRFLEFLAITGGLAAAALAVRAGSREVALLVVAAVAIIYANFLSRIKRAHFSWSPNLLALFGLPIFSYLLLRSRLYYKWRRSVTWKGRQYSTRASGPGPANMAGEKARPATGARWST